MIQVSDFLKEWDLLCDNTFSSKLEIINFKFLVHPNNNSIDLFSFDNIYLYMQEAYQKGTYKKDNFSLVLFFLIYIYFY